MDWKSLFFTADGRISRQNFWIGVLIIFAANVVLGWIPLIGLVVWAVGMYASICISSKRLHDMGKSGWLQLIPFGIGAVLMVIAMVIGGAAMMTGWMMHTNSYDMNPAAFAGVGAAAGLMGLAGLIGFIFMLWIGLTPGEAGENQYGPPPATTTPAPAA